VVPAPGEAEPLAEIDRPRVEAWLAKLIAVASSRRMVVQVGMVHLLGRERS
jgi:hypothetical protein